MIPREKFQIDLNELQKKLMQLGEFTDRALRSSVESLEAKDIDLAMKVMEDDNDANLLHEEINDFAILLIAKQAPVAIDLRRIITGMKIADDMERIADFAVNISKSTIRIRDEEHISTLTRIKKMYEITSNMFKLALEAFNEEDTQKARKVADMDDEVDDLFGKTVMELLQHNQQSPVNTVLIIQLLLVCRYLERAADHVTNIAEQIVYLVKGKRYDLNS